MCLRKKTKLEQKYSAWVKELVQKDPSLKGHWVEIMCIIESNHSSEVKAIESAWSRFMSHSDVSGGFMALIIKAEQEVSTEACGISV